MKHFYLLSLALGFSIVAGAQTISRIDTTRTILQETVVDTLMQVQERHDSVRQELPDVITLDPSRKGHYVQGYIGAGYSSMHISSSDNGLTGKGQAGGIVALQYAYFFSENWGVSIGLGASTYGGRSVLNSARSWQSVDPTTLTILNERVQDSDGEPYNHFTVVKDWTEQHRMWTLDVPVSLQWQKLFSPKGGMYASVGVSVGLPVSATYRLKSGELEHTGYYPWSDLTLTANSGKSDFRTETADNFSQERQKATVAKIQAAIKGDLGGLFPVDPNWDLMVGAYIRYTANNMQVQADEELGWRNGTNHPFMNEYKGLMSTDVSGAMRPWQVGLRIGAQWHYRKKEVEHPVIYTPFTAFDTTYTAQERIVEHILLHFDTVYTAPEPEVIPEPEPMPEPAPIAEPQKPGLKELCEQCHIYFELNSSTPKEKSGDLLTQIADLLKNDPNARMEVNGHTCSIGNRAYNQRLSERRAQAVADKLIRQGVRAEQLEVHGYCFDRPAEEGQHDLSHDRRVILVPLTDK